MVESFQARLFTNTSVLSRLGTMFMTWIGIEIHVFVWFWEALIIYPHHILKKLFAHQWLQDALWSYKQSQSPRPIWHLHCCLCSYCLFGAMQTWWTTWRFMCLPQWKHLFYQITFLFSYHMSQGPFILMKHNFLIRCNTMWASKGHPWITGHSFWISGTTELLLAAVPPDIENFSWLWYSQTLSRWLIIGIQIPSFIIGTVLKS